MKFDWQHWLLLLGTPCAVAFLDYLVNSNAPFSVPALEHAGLATALVGLTLLKQSVLTPTVSK
jgi:hypothetical protein